MSKTKKIFVVMLLVLFVGLVPASAFDKGSHMIGPHVGIPFQYGVELGAWYEYGIIKYFGVGAEIDYGFVAYGYASHHLQFMATIAGHYPIGAFDLFLKVGLGYGIYLNRGANNDSPNGYFAWNPSLGMRYAVSRGMDIRVELGWPTYLRVGLDFKL